MSDDVVCEQQSLRTQLVELNTRARTYTSRLWQVPFAYLGILGIVLAQVSEKPAEILITALFCGGLLGSAVLIHMTALLEGSKRAVTNIVKVENQLGLEQTAKHRPVWHIGPLISVVVLAILFCFGAGAYYLCRTL